MKSDRLGHSSSSRGGLSGPNDDSSVVSLKALVAKAAPGLSAARAPSSEDSGVIDLKKLMANAPPASDALPPVLAPSEEGLFSEAGLFDMPENTLVPHVAPVSGESNDAPAMQTAGRAKWLVAAMFVALAVVGTKGILHARTPQVAQLQRGVAAAMPATTSEPNKFVETPRPVETAPAVAVEVPATKATAPVEATTTRRTRKVATSRDQPRQEATTVKSKVDAPQPPPPAACDLMCEIARAAARKKK
jgi:hypothetical protein